MRSAQDLEETLETAIFGSSMPDPLLSAVLGAVPLAAALADENLRILAANARFCILLDRPAAEIEGRGAPELLALENPQLVLGDLRGLPPGQSALAPAQIRRQDGAIESLGLRVAPLELAGSPGMLMLTLHEPEEAHGAEATEPACGHHELGILCRPLADTDGAAMPFLAVLADPEHRTGERRSLERVVAAIRSDRRVAMSRTYLVPVPLALFEEPVRAAAFLADCRTLTEAVRDSLILVLDELPVSPQSEPIRAALEGLRPFASKVALGLTDLKTDLADLESLGVGLLALPTDRLAEAYREDPERLARRCRQWQDAGIALLGRDIATLADAEFARLLHFDFICYAADPAQLPQSRLFALLGVGGDENRAATLPHDAIIEATDSGIIYVDATQPDCPIVRVNAAFLALTGYAEREVLGRNCRFLQGPDTDPAAVAEIAAAMRRGEAVRCELLNYRRDGTRFWNQLVISPVRDAAGRIIAFAGMQTDVTQRREAQDELTYLRDHDPLTGLPNAAKFHSELAGSMDAARAAGRSTALYMVDFVRFHEINDTYGMPKGNLILTLIAERLSEAFPAGSRCYRLQADGFAVVGAVEGCRAAKEVAEAAAAALSAPFALADGPISLPARIGVCLDGHDSTGPVTCEAAREFAQRADIALHAAKRCLRPGVCFYSSDVDDRLRTSVIFKQSIRSAIEQRQFELHYQPLVALHSGQIVGAEALVRWNHPTLGLQTPDAFIPVAEESGLIGPLGEWILRDALRAARVCTEAGLPMPRVAVNVSGAQISEPDFVPMVEQALLESGLDPRMLELELTETFLIGHGAQTAQTLATLRARGIRIAIDDFGAGYSSFHYLRHLPVDKLKVDRSFISHLLPDGDGDVAILKAMVAMSRSLGVELAVEGIETPFQREVLTRIGCGVGQGYYFCRPQPLYLLMGLLASRSLQEKAGLPVGD